MPVKPREMKAKEAMKSLNSAPCHAGQLVSTETPWNGTGCFYQGFYFILCRENAHFFIPSSDWDHYHHLWRNQTPRRAEITNTVPDFQLQTSREIKTMSEMSVLSMTPKAGIEEYTEIIISYYHIIPTAAEGDFSPKALPYSVGHTLFLTPAHYPPIHLHKFLLLHWPNK